MTRKTVILFVKVMLIQVAMNKKVKMREAFLLPYFSMMGIASKLPANMTKAGIDTEMEIKKKLLKDNNTNKSLQGRLSICSG